MAPSVVPLRILAGSAIIALLYVGRPVLVPMVLAVFLFYALDPLVDRLQRLRVPRVPSAIAVVIVMLTAAGAGAMALWPQVEAVVTKIPDGAQQLRETLRGARASRRGSPTTLEKVEAAAKAIDETAAESATPMTNRGTLVVEVANPWRASELMWSGGIGVLVRLGQFVGVLFLTIFLLAEDDSFKRKLVRRMGSLGDKRLTVDILNDVASQIERFIWVQAATSVGVAVVTGLALWWLGIDQPAAWGAFAGVMNLVPFFGPFIVACVLGTVAFLQLGAMGDAAIVAATTLVITSIEGNFLTPKLLSRMSSLNLVAMFVAIGFWSAVWGVAGMLLAVPMLMAVKVVSDRVQGLEGLADFLGE